MNSPSISILGPEICTASFGGYSYVFELEEYLEDENKDEFHSAMKNFMQNFERELNAAEKYIFQYYLDAKKAFEEFGCSSKDQ